ncbi:restriction endonuclease subunit S [Sphingobium baderi]|uniref:restriction endonuclease subunit S n=1 Tax=Sphingobium baderi TaxID=1332080 RepID=UPI00040DD65D|nr:restriction endonuclease subunit S [Sphingobium baderi]KMS63866.1 type I restriction endonuclease subunit R [Sphingobium baderi LL03]
MTEQASDNQGLVPKLRFPEFRDAGEWVEKPLGEFASLISERVGGRQFIPLSITSGVGLISQEEKFGRTIAGQQLKNYLVLRKGDFAYNKSATKLYPQGYAVMYQGDEVGCVPSSIFACFSVTDNSVAKSYINYQLSANLHGRWLSRFTTIGARANGSLNVDDNDLLALPVPLPEGPAKFAEQQKIADFLSSLDALINVETDKLAVLRDHKKGLMQQLFPVKGETTPRLRFPEFRNAGEWEERPLGDLAENLDNRRVPIASSARASGEVPYYGASGIVDYVADYIFDEDILCISEDGANLVARSTPIAFSVSGKCWINNHAHVLKFEKMHTQILVEQYLNAISLEDFLTGVAQPKLNRGMLDVIPVPIPNDEGEQRKIAVCLSSLDALIASQNDSVAALKNHQSGLMQQLFPSPDEAVA